MSWFEDEGALISILVTRVGNPQNYQENMGVDAHASFRSSGKIDKHVA